MTNSDDDFGLNNESCSIIRLTIDGASIEEALPTLNTFVEYLRTFGRASHSDSAEVYYKFPNTIFASVCFIPSEPLRETMDNMIISLEAPAPFHHDRYRFAWDERESGQRIKLFPMISWTTMRYPFATFDNSPD